MSCTLGARRRELTGRTAPCGRNVDGWTMRICVTAYLRAGLSVALGSTSRTDSYVSAVGNWRRDGRAWSSGAVTVVEVCGGMFVAAHVHSQRLCRNTG